MDVQQIFRRGVDLVGPQLDLKGAPGPVAQLDDRVDLPAAVILVVVQAAAEGLGVDPQIPFTQRLKEKAQGLHIPQQPRRGGLEQSTGQGGIGKVPLLRLLHPHRGPNTGRKGGLVVGEEEPLEDVQIGRHGVAVDVLIVHRLDVPHEGLVGGGGALVAGQGAQQLPHLLGVPLYPVHPVYVVVNDGVQIRPGKQRRLLRRKAQAPGPTPPDDEGNECLQIHFPGHGGGQLPTAQLLQGHLSAGIPGLPEGHGAHPNPSDPPGAAVEDALVVGRG